MFPFFLKSLNARSGYAPKTTKALKAAALGRIDKHKKEGVIGGVCAWILQKKHFHSSGSFLLTQEKKNNGINYHLYYSSAPSGGQRTIEGRMCNASKSEAECVRIQRAST
jgi:hypothetical protein